MRRTLLLSLLGLALLSLLGLALLSPQGCTKQEPSETEEDTKPVLYPSAPPPHEDGPKSIPREQSAPPPHEDGPESIPRFPWPPPMASATAQIPSQFFLGNSNKVMLLSDVDVILRRALESCGYADPGYYRVPGGFALVTPLEQINADRTSKEKDRWAVTVQPVRGFSPLRILSAFFAGKKGYFRVIVFIVTPHEFSQSDTRVAREEAVAWRPRGFNALPPEIGNLEYTDKCRCTVHIYEYEQPDPDQPAKLQLPSPFQGKEHLEKAGIWKALEAM